MKYALFEFATEKTCEVGETSWIMREDPDTFTDTLWDFEREVLVKWPSDMAKISKRIIKSSIDISTVETSTCVGKVIRFSGKFIFDINRFL